MVDKLRLLKSEVCVIKCEWFGREGDSDSSAETERPNWQKYVVGALISKKYTV